MRTFRLALIAAAIVALAFGPRPAAAQSEPPAESSISSSDPSGGAGRSGDALQTPSAPPSTAPAEPIGAGLPSGLDEEGPIQKHSNEFELYTSGGVAPWSITKGDGTWDVGVRYGRVMTRPFMPGFMRGYLESAWDVMPVFEVYQPGGAIYGFAVDTLDLKWVYDVHRRVVPYWEFTGGLLFSRHTVPERPLGSTAFNFMPQAAAGVHIFSGRYVWSLEFRLVHISNGGIREPNDGITTLQGRIGFGQFRPPHRKEK